MRFVLSVDCKESYLIDVPIMDLRSILNKSTICGTMSFI